MIIERNEHGVALISLNHPAKRNALGLAMFDALVNGLEKARNDGRAGSILLRGEGEAFCAGFDLEAAAADPPLMATYIRRLSNLMRLLRRLPQPVVAAVHGVAIAGGCALLSACDFVVAAPTTRLGYPVHRISVSPAVTLPTLVHATGPGGARALLLSGDLVTAEEARRIGLVTSVSASDDAVFDEAAALARSLATKPPRALRATKAWLNDLDGSREDRLFDETAQASASLTARNEARSALREYWSRMQKGAT